jgi:serine/threonine-protein kinase 24/25/MST4
MEYVNGGSLLDHIKIEPLNEKYIAIVAREVLLGLQYLNNEGKIHRDIKAANILIGTEGSVKLADFGASRALNDTMSKCNTFVGSPYWMSPDVITQHDYDGKADIWSLGITCIELAQGKPPHTNVNPMAVLQVIIRDPPPQLIGNFSKDFKEFVALCLVKDPQQRCGISELLKTKFIKNAKKTKFIAELFGGEDL